MPAIPELPGHITFTLGASNVTSIVTFPSATKRLTVFFKTNDGKATLDTTQVTGAVIVANHMPIDKDRYFQVWTQQANGKGPLSINLAALIAATDVLVIAEAG